MSDEHPEPFDLPDWGTDGAPPEPATDDAEELEPARPEELDVLLDVRQELLLSTVGAPPANRVRTVLGLVASEGSASISDGGTLQAATGSARSAALDRLTSDAEAMGATAVVGMRLTVAVRLNEVVVTAYGTAVDAGQV